MSCKFKAGQIVIYFLFLFFISHSGGASAPAHKLIGLRITKTPTYSRLIFDLTGPVNYHAFLLKNPPRIVIDLPNTRVATNLNHPALINTNVKSIRANFAKNKLRLTLDLKKSAKFKLSTHRIHNAKHVHLIFDLTPMKDIPVLHKEIPTHKEISAPKETSAHKKTPAPKKISTARLPPVIGPKPEVNKPKVITLNTVKKINQKSTPAKSEEEPKITLPTPAKKFRDIVIVIDPGHGGHDSGAIGISGVREKDVVLIIAKHLQQILNEEIGFRAFLTRSGDYFLTLRERLRIAHTDKADMFIAIHADAYKITSQGVTIFALSQKGATSELARWIAEKENESELGHVIADKNLILKSVLIDLAQTLTIDNSLAIGRNLLAYVASVATLHFNHVEQAAFVVLKSPDIPSLLVETGFLSNPIEEKQLADSIYQRKIALAIAQGIENYFAQNPPIGTRLGAELTTYKNIDNQQ